MRPGGRPSHQRRVGEGRDGGFEDRPLGDPAVLRRVERTLHRIDPRRDDDPAAQQVVVLAVGGGERRQRRQHEVHLRDHARRANVARPPAQGRPNRDGVDQAGQRLLRVDPADDCRGVELVAVGQDDAGRTAVVRADRDDLGARADLRSGRTRRRRECFRQRARTALRVDGRSRSAAVVAG
jgi:hypothetical protein